ncbi:bacterial low temperature requirement A protein-domain-containing protein [Halenospora varia]|nr:bacterial low temperature requirement A protein-domain-containing protein [Halenospora varia]
MDPLMDGGKPKAKPSLQNLYLARTKESLRWIESPLKDLKGKEFKSFHVRHEASMLELFFDLFFVANLATFTAYHEITTSGTVLAYMGFFLILWSTWFQITIFDVRFASDSVFERICKLFQFIAFAVFAAVGANFSPGTYSSAKYYKIYQTMAIILGATRLLLAFQYAIMATYVCSKYKKLVVPFTLIIVTFIISGGGLIATSMGFGSKSISKVHIVWWIILPVESFIIVTISSVWRMLSFKETHMNERLSLLTMIIIGEGVIGVTKSSMYLWPKEKMPDINNLVALISIIIMLLLMWQIYFDNHPHGDYGTIKQQWWAMSHFFLHLGIVGTVEGSNRMAIFYYAAKTYTNVGKQIMAICTSSTKPTKETFVASMNYTLQYLDLNKYDPRTYDWAEFYLNRTLFPKANDVYFCNVNNENSTAIIMDNLLGAGIFKKFGIEEAERSDAYFHTFRVTFAYLWASFGVTMLMLLVFLWIVRNKKHDMLEFLRMGFRLIIALLSLAMVFLQYAEVPFENFITSPVVVTTICVLMAATIIVDRLCRFFGVWSFKRKYAIPPPLPDHGHGHDHAEGHSSSVDKHQSMAFGGHHTPSIATTMFPPGGYEMTPSASSIQTGPSISPGYAGQPGTPGNLYQNGGLGSPDPQYQNTAYQSGYAGTPQQNVGYGFPAQHH